MNKRLLMLNGLAIIGVVANHASHQAFVAMFWWTDRYRQVTVPNFDQMGSLSYYGLIAAQKLALFCVPSFLFVGGLFITYAARGNDLSLKWPIIKRRILNLLPSYLLWSLVIIIARYIFTQEHTPLEYLIGLLGFGATIYFYVPLLIEMYLISPLLVALAKNKSVVVLTVGTLMLLAFIGESYLVVFNKGAKLSIPLLWLFDYNLPAARILEYGPYFLLGMVCGFHLTSFKEKLIRYRWLLFALTVVLALVAIGEAEWLFRLTGDMVWYSTTTTIPTFLYIITFIFSFLAFENIKIPFSNTLYTIGSCSLGIYLIHALVILFVPKIVYNLAPHILGYQVIYMPLLILLGVGIPMAMMSIVRRTPFTRFYRYLFG